MPLQRTRNLIQVIDDIDPKVVKRRVNKLREQFPNSKNDELHKILVRGKCLQAGAAGAIQTLTNLVPGGNLIAPRVLGPLADKMLITVLQAELVMETLELYEIDATPSMRQALVAGLGFADVPKVAIEKWLENSIVDKMFWLSRLRWLNRTMMMKKLVSAAAVPMSETYSIGNRAAAIAKMPKAKLFEWPKLIAKAARLDESKLAMWAVEASKSALDQAQQAFGSWYEGLANFVLPIDLEADEIKIKKTRRKTKIIDEKILIKPQTVRKTTRVSKAPKLDKQKLKKSER